mgnify:CR=1 FL=1
MRKGIIVVDIPSTCRDCPVEVSGGGGVYWCPFGYKGYTNHIRETGKPDWCPIRPMPEKIKDGDAHAQEP